MAARAGTRFRRIIAASAIGLLLLGCAVAAVVLLSDTEAARRAIERKLSESLRGSVHYDALVLHFLPRPGAEIHGAVFRIPGVMDGRAAVIDVRLALLPLLAGNVRPAFVRMDRPVVELRVEPQGGGDPFEAYRAAVGPAVEMLVSRARGMTGSIVDGKLDVSYAGRPVAALSDLAASVTVSGDAVEAGADCTADLWGRAKARARVAAGTLAASGSVDIAGLRVANLLRADGAGDAVHVRPGAVDATVTAETDGRGKVRIAAKGTAPQLTIARGTRERDLGAVRAAGEIVREGAAITGTFRDLQVGELLRGGSGVVRATANDPVPAFELKAALIDAAQWHAAVMALFGQNDALPPWLTWVSAGAVRDISVSGAGRTIGEIMGSRAIRAQARLEGATVAVPAAGAEVRNASGRFLLSDGVLQAGELAGDIGRSKFSGGTLALELRPAARLRSLRMATSADLADALSIARHLFAQRAAPVIAGIEALAGRAVGTIDYDAGRSASPLILDLTQIQATARHRSSPLPLEVTRAELRYWGAGLRVRGLAGSAGRSRLRDGSIELALGGEPTVRAATADAVLVFDEVFPWLYSLDRLRPVLREIKSVTGSARVRLVRLSGALARPAALEFDAAIEPEEVRIQTPALYAPLVLTGGAGEVTSRTLRLKGVAFAAGDTHATVSGTIQDYAADGRSADLTMSRGAVGQQGTDWIGARWRLPEQVMPRAPVEIASARVQWPTLKGNASIAQGSIRVANAADVDFDLAWEPDDFQLKRLALKDTDTDMTAALRWQPTTVALSFAGSFDARTLERMLVRPPAVRGTVRGDFHAAIDVHEPQRSRATGTAEGEEIDLARPFGIPVGVERLRLEAADRVLRVHEGSIVVASQRLEITGTAEARQEDWAIDGRLTAKALDAQKLLEAVAGGSGSGKTRGAPSVRWDLPVSGHIAIAAESVAVGAHAIEQVEGSVELARNRVTTDVTRARLCGAMFPFTVAVTPDGVEAQLRLRARDRQLAETLPCLTGGRFAATGTYNLDLELTASGRPGSLRNGARGTFQFTARDGRIGRAAALTQALAIDEVARRLDQPAPKLIAEGVEYTEISAAGSLVPGLVRLDQGVLDSAMLGVTVRGEIALADGNIDLQGLVAPLGTFQRAVRRVPVLGRAVGASLIVVPISITGSVRDPEVKVLSAAAVGTTLVNLMSARFLLPINLLDIAGGMAPRKP